MQSWDVRSTKRRVLSILDFVLAVRKEGIVWELGEEIKHTQVALSLNPPAHTVWRLVGQTQEKCLEEQSWDTDGETRALRMASLGRWRCEQTIGTGCHPKDFFFSF